jgi:hypothetical protein
MLSSSTTAADDRTRRNLIFALENPEAEIEVASHTTPVPIGTSDSRLVIFLVRNLRLEFIRTSG